MYKGSVVVKRTTLLHMIENMKFMFRSNISKDSRWNVWGQQMAYECVLDEDLTIYDRNAFMHEIWDMSWTAGAKPSETFEWLFDPTPLEREEQIHLYTLLNWHMENKDRVYEILKELGEEI